MLKATVPLVTLLQTMQAAKATAGILKMCGSQKLLDQLTECNKLLESVQKVWSGTLYLSACRLMYGTTGFCHASSHTYLQMLANQCPCVSMAAYMCV